MDTGHNYLSVVYSTTIYPYNARRKRFVQTAGMRLLIYEGD